MPLLRGLSTFPATVQPGRPTFPRSTRRDGSGTTLAETAISLAVLGLIVATSLTCLTILNKNAISGRLMSSARELVQSNIEQAVGAPFTSSTIPSVLTVGTTTVATTVYKNRDGTGSIPATLTRTVTSVSSTVRAIKVSVDYTVNGRNLNYEMTTMRAMDK